MRSQSEETHPLETNHLEQSRPALRHSGAWRGALAFVAVTLLLLPALAQKTGEPVSPLDPLPQDSGTAGLKETLLRLQTTARLLQTTAHPDDEDGGMTLESRGKGVTVTLLTLNRGEGGQNKVGSNLFDVLGVLRTLELTAADRYYGVQQRFTRVADFGFSKSAEETFQKWHGHDIALGDMVRVIRTFRPDVLVSRFSGTSRDGHGHHQAAGILTQEAYHAAADPNRFPEQIKQGLLPWQAKKLYIGNVCRFFAQTCPDKNYTLKLNTGEVDQALGMSYIQFAMEGLRHQLSQGAGGWSAPAGPRYTFYKLMDSVLPPTTGKDGHEQSFFDGIDTSLPGLAARLGAGQKKVPFLQPALVEIADHIKDAAAVADKAPSDAVWPLFAAQTKLDQVVARLQKSNLSSLMKADLLQVLQEKRQQTQKALNLAMSVSLEATVLSPSRTPGLPREAEALTVISPGQKFAVRVALHNGSKYVLRVNSVSVDGIGHSPNNREEAGALIQPGQDHVVLFTPQLPAGIPDTRPYWHRDNPERDAINTVDEPRYATLPFPPAPFHVTASYEIAEDGRAANQTAGSEIQAPVIVPFLDEQGKEEKRTLAVAPEFSVMLEPGEQVIPTEDGSETNVKVGVSCNLTGAPKGKLYLEAPGGGG